MTVYTCEMGYNYTTNNKTNFYSHKIGHRIEKKHQCDLCSYGSNNKGTVNTHRNTWHQAADENAVADQVEPDQPDQDNPEEENHEIIYGDGEQAAWDLAELDESVFYVGHWEDVPEVDYY